MKRRIFWSVFFTVFLRLQIYEAIAAIFWLSSSNVSNRRARIFDHVLVTLTYLTYLRPSLTDISKNWLFLLLYCLVCTSLKEIACTAFRVVPVMIQYHF